MLNDVMIYVRGKKDIILYAEIEYGSVAKYYGVQSHVVDSARKQ